MYQINIEINSLDQLWQIIDKKSNNFYISSLKAYPFGNEKINDIFQTKYDSDNFKIKNLTINLITDLQGLRKILITSPDQIIFYQFNRKIEDDFDIIGHPSQQNLESLCEKGLEFVYECNWENLTIYSNKIHKLNEMAEYITFEDKLTQFKTDIDIRY